MKKLIDCLKVGDKVWHIIKGWATVLEINDNNFIVDVGGATVYQVDGRYGRNDTNPSLFLHEIKLEQELPEFVEGEIILASFTGEEYWFPARLRSINFDGTYTVKIKTDKDRDADIVPFIKSFDKSHFE